MKVEITQKIENPLLRRTEIKFRVDHTGGPTPSRRDVRAQLAAQLGLSEDLVIIEKMASLFGRQQASGIARAYGSRELLEKLEPRYLLKRNFPEEAEGAKPKTGQKEKSEGEEGG
ncbi:MAG: 30S ribosomal protein S24e [Hadesarchaea archaeon]|nr:30S ribosomal protein S24e [Hadesarchaea archaeon]